MRKTDRTQIDAAQKFPLSDPLGEYTILECVARWRQPVLAPSSKKKEEPTATDPRRRVCSLP